MAKNVFVVTLSIDNAPATVEGVFKSYEGAEAFVEQESELEGEGFDRKFHFEIICSYLDK